MHQIDLKLGANVYTNNIFRNVKKNLVYCPNFFMPALFYGNDRIQSCSANLTEKIVGVLNAKFYVLENNYIDSNCLYSQKRLILQKTLAVLVKAHEKSRCGGPYPYR